LTRRARRLALAALPTLAATFALLASAAFAGPPPVASTDSGPDFAPGEVVVRFVGEGPGQAVDLPDGVGVGEAARALRGNPQVAYAVPNYIATASAVPNDPGTVPPRHGAPKGWTDLQWNFLPCGTFCGAAIEPPAGQSAGGIDALGAWKHLRRSGHSGAAGVKVAVLDTGIAYKTREPHFERSPDFGINQFVPGHDFISKDAEPLDVNGHGTHVAGTIAERTNNGTALTGLAYRAKLMPIRVLNAAGSGKSDTIAKGIRFAARHGADVINMSFNFRCGNTVPPVAQAMHFAYRRGAVLVASIGNGEPRACITMPATDSHAIAVGGTTEDGCLGSYSRVGPRVDLVAPGGGLPVAGCPTQTASRPIFQLTFRTGRPKQWAIPSYYEGTSMSAAHVTGVAAMVIASGVIGPNPSPAQVLDRLQSTARDLGDPGRDDQFGSGLIDAAAATKR
jgi:serine protease